MNEFHEDLARDVQGELSDEQLAEIDWDRLAYFTREVVLAQPHDIRKLLFERKDLDLRLTPFTADGFTTITLYPEELELVRLHFSRLLPGPYGAQDMKLVQ